MKKEWQHLGPEEFPPLLREIPDAPKKVWVEGTLPHWDEVKMLAVVGSRKYSQYGKDACEKLIMGLSGYPIVIVSGLAIGIDTIAHKSALKAGLKTIAIPGSGLDRSVIHPRSNSRLADEIVESGGALISEQEPTAPAGLHTFPRRNRIMAGLSHAILIVEAGEQSGTLITARLALDYNRDVLAVPGSIFAQNSHGTHELIRTGAALASESTDILRVLELTLVDETRALPLQSLSPKERALVELIANDPLSRDDIIRELSLPVNEVNTTLAQLEIRGIIVERGGEFHLS